MFAPLFQEILPLYLRLTQTQIGRTSFNLKTHELQRNVELIQEALVLDPTGLTAWLAIGSMYRAYIQSEGLSFAGLLALSPESSQRLEDAKTIQQLLATPHAVAEVEQFKQQMRAAAQHYGAEITPDFQEWLEGEGLGVLRRDALHAVEHLRVHQFAWGKGDSEPLRFNKDIYEFWNMNSLLAAMRNQQLPGITLCLLRAPEAVWSFFVIAIKNGDNLTVLTDRPARVYPEYEKKVRCVGRELLKRACSNWFPYELLNVHCSADTKHAWAEARTQLVPLQVEAVVLSTIAACSPPTVLWLGLVFALLQEKFGKQTPRYALSYTTEMLRRPNALIGEHSQLVQQGLYTPLSAPPLAPETLAAACRLEQRAGLNDWWIARYEGQVPLDGLDVIGDREKEAAIQTHAVLAPSRAVYRDPVEQIASLSPTDFDSAESLLADRAWVTRKNQIRILQDLANQECEREKDSVVLWVKARIGARRDFFVDHVIRTLDLSFASLGYTATERRTRHQRSRLFVSFGGHLKRGSSKAFCALNPDLEATGFARALEAFDPGSLAFLCGCTVEELPIFLQHTWESIPSCGNPNLERLDPADYMFKNPWAEFAFGVQICLSKTEIQRRRKALGLARATFKESE